VLVHGGFSDHKTNWQFVKPLFEKHFTAYAIGELDSESDTKGGKHAPWQRIAETAET
jgi:hypothetical protein